MKKHKSTNMWVHVELFHLAQSFNDSQWNDLWGVLYKCMNYSAKEALGNGATFTLCVNVL